MRGMQVRISRGGSRPGSPLRACLPRVLLAALSIVLAAPATAAADHCPGWATSPHDTTITAARKTTVCLINYERRRYGIRSIRAHDSLTLAAARHASDMDDRNYFSHYTPGGQSPVDRIRRAGYRMSGNWGVGENLAWGGGTGGTPRAMVRLWMDSSAHRRTLLKSSYLEVGIGIARGAPRGGVSRGVTFVADFGYR